MSHDDVMALHRTREQILTAYYKLLDTLERKQQLVIIPRAHHEALMAAAKAADAVCHSASKDYKVRRWNEYTELCLAVAALRAAGVDLSEDKA